MSDGANNEIPGEDEKLLKLWQSGDRAAGDVFVTKYYPLLSRFFRSRIQDSNEMVDALQETLMRLSANLGNVRHESFRSYVFGIARNVLMEKLRSHYRHTHDPLLSSSSLAMIGQSLSSQLSLTNALATLSVEEQDLLDLHYWNGFTAEELASIEGVSAAAVRSKLHRARVKLREALTHIPWEREGEDDALERKFYLELRGQG